MIKIVYRVRIKQGREKEFKELTDKILIPIGTNLKGCIIFFLFETNSNKREFIFYEIWENEGSVENYYKELIQNLGKNSPGKIFPDKLNDFIEEEEDILHQETVEAK